jgi:hypothetical protein
MKGPTVAKSAVLALKITGDASGATRALGDADDKSRKFGKGLAVAGAAAGAAIGAIGILGKAAFDSASNLEQQAGAVDAIFGKNAAKMHGYAKAAAQTVGLAQSEYSQLASVLGAQLSNAGFAGDKLTGTVDGLVTKGADLAAQFGGSTAEAVEALSSVLKGETDPIERYGVSLKQSDINARLAALGQDQLTGAALKNATAAAALALVTEQTTTATGAFARESDTAAGKQAQLTAWWENAKAALGERLLPVFVGFATFLQEQVAPIIDRLIGQGGPLSTMFATVAGFITGQVIPALSSLWNELAPKVIPILQTVGRIITNFVVPAFMAVWGIVQQYVVPIIRSVLSPALDGLRSAFDTVEGALERNAGKFSGLLEKVRPLLDFLKNTVAPFIGGALKTGFEALSTVLGNVIDAIAWVLDKAAAVGGFIGDVGSFLFGGATVQVAGGVAPAPAAGLFGAAQTAPGLFGASNSLPGGGAGPSTAGRGTIATGDVYHVTVTGALDPAAVADQIDRLLSRRARRIGAAPAVAR